MIFFNKLRGTDDKQNNQKRKLSLFGKHILLGKAIITTLANNYQELKERIYSDQTRLDDFQVQTLVHLISSKPSNQRSPIELEFLKCCLLPNKFFSFINSVVKKKSTLDQFYKSLIIKEMRPSELLFSQGDLSFQLYVVLYGEVIVMLPRQHDKPLPKAFNFLSKEAAQMLHQMYEDFVVVNQISTGTFFGEVGLIHKVPRTATIVAHPQRQKTLLGVYEAETFYSIIQPILSLQMRQKIDMLKQVPILHNLTKKQLSIFCAACMEKNFRLGQTIFHEGEPGSFLYILTSGQVEFFKLNKAREILLYQTTEFQVIGTMLNEQGYYWMGAKASSAFVQLFKISSTVFISQLEKWGIEVSEPPCKEEWVKQCFSKYFSNFLFERQIFIGNQAKCDKEDSPKVNTQQNGCQFLSKILNRNKHSGRFKSANNISITNAVNEHQEKLSQQFNMPIQAKKKLLKVVSGGDQVVNQYCSDIRKSSQQYFINGMSTYNKEKVPLKTQSSQMSVRIQNTSTVQNLYESISTVFGKSENKIDCDPKNVRFQLIRMMNKKLKTIRKQDKFKQLSSFDINSILQSKKSLSPAKTSVQSRRISIKNSQF